jgi:hypothetical protein
MSADSGTVDIEVPTVLWEALHAELVALEQMFLLGPQRDLVLGETNLGFEPVIRWWYLYKMFAPLANIVESWKEKKVAWKSQRAAGYYARHTPHAWRAWVMAARASEFVRN